MKNKKHYIRIITAISILAILILDTNTAKAGALEGIDISFKVVIPSLFPFLIVTTYLNAALLGYSLPGFQFICRKLNIPVGCEFILPLGLIGGYPVGAKLVSDIYNVDSIDKRTAKILLGYCNNAGPAFIFGIAGAAFLSPIISVILWLIHIGSAVITAFLLPRPYYTKSIIKHESKNTLSCAVKSSLSACASVCGWIVTFKIILAYLSSWFHGFFQTECGVFLTGILELSNGCLSAMELPNSAARFIIFSVFFAFGGLCVYLQTCTVTESIGTGLYIHGKIVQTCVSLIASLVAVRFIFHETVMCPLASCFLSLFAAVIVLFVIKHTKKVVEIT